MIDAFILGNQEFLVQMGEKISSCLNICYSVSTESAIDQICRDSVHYVIIDRSAVSEDKIAEIKRYVQAEMPGVEVRDVDSTDKQTIQALLEQLKGDRP